MDIAERVRKARKQRGWRQQDLAYHAGLAISTIWGIEQGRFNPSKKTVAKIERALAGLSESGEPG